MNPPTIEAVLFDLDGTLVDTEVAAAAALDACFLEWGVQLDAADSQFITGRTWDTAFRFLLAKYPLAVSYAEATTTVLARYRANLEAHLPVVPGAREAILSIARRWPLALVSGSSREQILWALDRLQVRDHFQVILGAEDYPRSKPAPDGYAKALAALRVAPERTVIFEDSTAGIASARDVGAWVIAITDTNHFQQDTSRAHVRIADLSPVSDAWIDAGERPWNQARKNG